jgi:hypothetical protein
MDEKASLGVGLLSGFAALYLVGTLMKFLKSFKADGTLRIDRAVGQIGTVYLRIPGNHAGPGKVTLNLQNRHIEVDAYTSATELPTGSPVVVTAVLKSGSVEVIAK